MRQTAAAVLLPWLAVSALAAREPAGGGPPPPEPAGPDAAEPAGPDAAEPAGPRWAGKLGLSLTGFAGNKESRALSASLQLARVGSLWEWGLDGEAHVLQIDREANQQVRSRSEEYEAESGLRRLLGERTYAIGRLVWERKPGSGIESELQGGIGLGYHLARGEDLAVRVEGGIARTEEEQVAETLRYTSLFLEGLLTTTLPKGARLTWTSGLRLTAEGGSDLKSDQEIELDSPLTERLSLGLKGEWKYDSDPQPGFVSSDFKLVARIAFRFLPPRP